MAEAPRVFAGLEITWPDASGDDDDPTAGLVLAEADAFAPSAAESLPAGLRLFFTSPAKREAAGSHLRAVLPECTVQAINVPDGRWAERSQASLTAVRVGALTVAPPWDAPADRSGTIIIQPSMGFGTGHHASTRLCLQLLQAAPVKGASVLDAGTGSGVLAIAAWKLGARHVTAVDVDADAITCAAECAELNDASGLIDFREIDLEREPSVSGEPFDLILANLTGGMLVRMADRLCRLAIPGGTLIVSGVTRAEEAAVTQAFADCHATLVTRLVENPTEPRGFSPGEQSRAPQLTDDEWVGLRFSTAR